MASLKSSPAWKALKAHLKEISRTHMRDMFAEDPGRFERFSLGLDGLFLDYSKNRITDETMGLLVDLANDADVEEWRQRMFGGDNVNTTENRPALHVALRTPADGGPLNANGKDVMPAVLGAREKMRAISEQAGNFKAVVHIGTGGSYLGPAMAAAALRPYRRSGVDLRFVANVDGAEITDALDGLKPETTLFIVASKSFATQETMTNAGTARAWLAESLGDGLVGEHFIAVTANEDAAQDFGIAAEKILPLWDWVGGRFSLCSTAGLPLAMAIGMDRFEEMLAGAHAMDRHFAEAPLNANMPVVLALIGVWNADFLGAGALAVLPYDQGLQMFPSYIRQLEMESGGKSTDRDGGRGASGAAPVVFGEPGTRGQHAFYQALHQGPHPVACDFIACAESQTDESATAPGHHHILLANFLAQPEALMMGRTKKDAQAAIKADGVKGEDAKRQLPHRMFEGNRPSNSILLDRLDPFTLGQLTALYEHKVFVEGVIWGINPFDQWGVELGKELALGILGELQGDPPPDNARGRDSSTQGLIARIKAGKAKKP